MRLQSTIIPGPWQNWPNAHNEGNAMFINMENSKGKLKGKTCTQHIKAIQISRARTPSSSTVAVEHQNVNQDHQNAHDNLLSSYMVSISTGTYSKA